MNFSLGIGLTNACNYNCSHCYSRESQESYLSFDRLKSLCDNLDIVSINFGTGESYLHDEFLKIVEYVYEKKIKMSVTSNGYTISKLDDTHLKMFNDVDLSLDFFNTDSHDEFRGLGASKTVFEGAERCKKLGVEASLACAMMKENYREMDQIAGVGRKIGLNLRTNIYKPVNTFKHALDYDEFWEGIRRLFGSSKIVSCSEPIVNALIGNKTLDGGSPCGKKSLRVKPDGGIVPCVYWKQPQSSIEQLIENKQTMSRGQFRDYIDLVTQEQKIIPKACIDCKHLDTCQGGCAAGRFYRNIEDPDPYCFMLGKDIPEINYEWGESKDLVHSDYLCTIIVQ